ncbi:MAG: SBBP repeat-containing protein, partial [Ignavibacteria bacterium]|nr:SBBP repeat-containing protein [Ignavibacteria bacterium]
MKNIILKLFSNINISLILIVSSVLILSVTTSAQISPEWQSIFNDSIPSEAYHSYKSKIDNEGSLILLGYTYSSNGADFVTVKYSSQGHRMWYRQYNGTGNSSEYPRDLVIDRYNNIYITGRSWGGNATKNDYMTLKYSPSGELLWSKRFDWLVSRNDQPYSVALDSNDNVYVTGFAAGSLTNNGDESLDMVTVKYNSSGDQLWVRSFGGSNEYMDWGYSVVCDRFGNLYVSGFTLSTTLLNNDIITVKYDFSGNEKWQRRFDNKGDDYIRPLMSKVDNSDNLVIASYYKGDSSLIDYLTLKYDVSGNLLWSKFYDGGARNNDWINDIIIDNQNNVYIAGTSWLAESHYDYLTIKYSYSGDELWRSRINDSSDVNGFSGDNATSMAMNRNGEILVYGNSEFFQDY